MQAKNKVRVVALVLHQLDKHIPDYLVDGRFQAENGRFINIFITEKKIVLYYARLLFSSLDQISLYLILGCMKTLKNKANKNMDKYVNF